LFRRARPEHELAPPPLSSVPRLVPVARTGRGGGRGVASGEIATAIWHLLPTYVEAGEVLVILPTVLVIALRRRWNPFGQLFLERSLRPP
jgi:hypothetical protein